MGTAMGIGQDLPHTSQSKSWCGDGKIYRWCWPVHMLGLKFHICVGCVIDNTQIVFIGESLNDFTPGVNIMTAPYVVVSTEVTRDKYLAHHQTLIYDNLTASITLDCDRHWKRSAPAQCPACTQNEAQNRWFSIILCEGLFVIQGGVRWPSWICGIPRFWLV